MNNYMKIIINALKQWVNENFAALDAKILNKVDIVEGKGLSTEDFTTEHKNKLDSITMPLSDGFIPDNIARVSDVDDVKSLIGDTSVSEQINEAIGNIEIPEVNYPVTSVNGQTGDVVIEIPEQKDITVNGVSPDESGNIQIEIGSGGVSSWNDLTDKPFYEKISPVTIEWDGNKEGREVISKPNEDMYFVHVSDITPTTSEIINATVYATESYGNEVYEYVMTEEEAYWGRFTLTEYTDDVYEVSTVPNSSRANFVVVKVDGASLSNGLIFPKAGVYFSKDEDAYMSGLSLLEYTEIRKIDEKFIPDSIARMDDITWDNLEDKPFGELNVAIEWDGNTSDRDSATGSYTWYHVSDNVPTVDELIDGIYTVYLHSNSSFNPVKITNRKINISGDCIIVDTYILIAKADNAVIEEGSPYPEVLPKAGIYFINISGNGYCSSLSYNATKTLDEKFIPDTIARAEHTHEDYALKTDILSPKSEFILNSSTEGSTKQFKLTIDDTGTLTITEIVDEVE